MSSITISLSPAQCKRIRHALTFLDGQEKAAGKAPPEDAYSNKELEYHNLAGLEARFGNLKPADFESPATVHGFCI